MYSSRTRDKRGEVQPQLAPGGGVRKRHVMAEQAPKGEVDGVCACWDVVDSESREPGKTGPRRQRVGAFVGILV
ncbi:hypothetical protein Hypma_003137 [Hypsizygus marmoreus]|uniref:Uncharacterized protein n=1 Tax=Hypsizygus marmoreus TaxID=39966 RepID=A0A369J2J0_HYPMA|nr:hypothetical protein Hypma_003137 [Hypsizygus marmoreus]